MSPTICSHCGERNAWDEDYCQNCGARLAPAPQRTPEPAPPVPETEPAAQPTTAATSGPQRASTTQAPPDSPEPPLGLSQLAGLIPERDPLSYAPYQETAISDPASPGHPDPVLPSLSSLAAASPGFQLTGRMPLALQRQRLLYWLLLLVALIPFGLNGTDTVPPHTPIWDGVTDVHRHMEVLEPGDNILVYWQNEPGIAGELDLAAVPVLQHLLAAGTHLHILSQHPLGLQHFHTIRDTLKTDWPAISSTNQVAADIDTLVHILGFWPGGYIVLPHMETWLRTTPPDLQLIVTPHMADILYWLELVAPFTDAPAVVITSAGTGQVIRPYLDTGQVVGLISGYDGALQYTTGSTMPVPAAYEPRMALHVTVHNWITVCLVLVILVTVLFQGQPTLPWISQDA